MKGEVKQVNGKRVASPEYRSWQMMKNRCLNAKARDYKYYGGRGIWLDERWNKFENFVLDMGRRPSSKYTLERLNSNEGYTPKNCMWATREQQARNREYCKLTLADARAIRQKYASGGYRQSDLAHMYGVSQRTICLITRNEGWREEGGE